MAVGNTFILDEKQGKSLNRIDTKTNWEAVNPVLAIGEMGIEKDGLLQNIKVGDGVTPWNNLQYIFKSCPYEVGDILVTMNATDPAVRWPGTRWEAFAPGRVLIGAGKGTDINGTSMEFKVGATGGEYSHQLTVGELPSHSHEMPSWIWAVSQNFNTGGYNIPNGYTTGNACTYNDQKNGLNGQTQRAYVTQTGDGNKHNLIQPYSIAYCYRRIG